jgi:hypothetical protein
MKPPVTPFTAVYSQWLASFRAMLPGFAPPPAEAAHSALKKERVAATQEWEDEGGSVKPAPTPEVKDAPKIPF